MKATLLSASFVLLLSSLAGPTYALTPCTSSTAGCPGAPCQELGVTQLSADQQNVIYCTKNPSTTGAENLWKTTLTQVDPCAAGQGITSIVNGVPQCSGIAVTGYFRCGEHEVVIGVSNGAPICAPDTWGKPVINLYPEKEQKTLVQLLYKGHLTATYPTYDLKLKGWEVIAYPDGHLVNLADKETYSYLFWEGNPYEPNYDFSTGFVVAGSDTAAFLRSSLKQLGLTPKEYNEFIVFWLPKMENNKYNLIHFADKEYTDAAVLRIEPKPDSLLRVFMVYKALDEKMEVKPQTLPPFERKGFSVVEWGGVQVR